MVWRTTTAPLWEGKSRVITDTHAVLPVLADDCFFAVRAVDAAGHESQSAIPARP
jgi:hypothetical protein